MLSYWKEAFDTLDSIAEFNLHVYLASVQTRPHLKNIFDKYLALKKSRPGISCMWYCAPRIVREAFETMLHEVYPHMGRARLNSLVNYLGQKRVRCNLSSIAAM